MPDPKKISILDVEFTVDQPFEEGHTCTAAEAKVLNQTRGENLSNIFRKSVKAAKDDGSDDALKAVRKEFAERNKSYEFTLASAGGSRSTLTPLEKESRKVARDALRDKLREAGVTYKAYLDEKGKEYVDAKILEIAENEAIQKVAKSNIKEREKMQETTLGVAL